MANDKVMEILKKDEKANKMMKMFHDNAVLQGVEGNEYEEMRKTMLMLIISNTPEAMSAMANEVYNHHNQ